jgi:tRNA A-37 threonylcarbamoyl transferase component Bud32
MEIITIDAFHSLLSNPNNTIITTKYNKPKLIENSNGEITKIFYPKKRWRSSNRRRPYALRFYKNATLLSTHGIQAPHITSLKYCPDMKTYMISYKKIPGENVRVLMKQNEKTLLTDVAKYIATLHQKGIFFRALHLENLLYQQGEFILIDIDDVTFKNKPLNFRYRYRNLKHMFLVNEDKEVWNTENIKNFMELYFQYANLSLFSKMMLSFVLRLSFNA